MLATVNLTSERRRCAGRTRFVRMTSAQSDPVRMLEGLIYVQSDRKYWVEERNCCYVTKNWKQQARLAISGSKLGTEQVNSAYGYYLITKEWELKVFCHHNF